MTVYTDETRYKLYENSYTRKNNDNTYLRLKVKNKI